MVSRASLLRKEDMDQGQGLADPLPNTLAGERSAGNIVDVAIGQERVAERLPSVLARSVDSAPLRHTARDTP